MTPPAMAPAGAPRLGVEEADEEAEEEGDEVDEGEGVAEGGGSRRAARAVLTHLSPRGERTVAPPVALMVKVCQHYDPTQAKRPETRTRTQYQESAL